MFEQAIKVREIPEPSPVNKVEPIPEGISFFLFSQVKNPLFISAVYKLSLNANEYLI